MADSKIHAQFDGRLVIIGFGTIGQGVLPLILRHIEIKPSRITIVTAEDWGGEEAADYGIRFVVEPLTVDNYRRILEPIIRPGDFILNLSVEVSSLALIELAQERGALYLDTCIEPWAGGYTDISKPQADRTNYALREAAMALKAKHPGGPTAILTHGANPGMVSHFVKQALLDIAGDTGLETEVPADRAGWAKLAQTLGVKVIHIAERDTQKSSQRKRAGEFVNTWSIDGFVGEGCQPAELGWGSHEKALPPDGIRQEKGSRAAIFLSRPGASTRVRTWTPKSGPFHGFLITHSEAISIAAHLSVGDGDHPEYRPTVHYSYHPCDDAVLSVHELAGRNWKQQPEQRLLMEDIAEGIDELGVLLMGHARGAYWFGSQLSIGEARRLVPHNNATSLQVTSAVLAGMIWAIRHPKQGIVEADDMDFREVLDIQMPYLGPVVGVYSDWTPLAERTQMFEEDLDREDPWQFKNFRVT
ncbi:MAG TPA: saccharopine dehydrogenase NADP-binding domain-containing protein [Alphaproteobacteria bacterium]|nr:saccharopine dehydrogenase NADP-binding domain-containing protein [Alphaproteobacteria bacterium]